MGSRISYPRKRAPTKVTEGWTPWLSTLSPSQIRHFEWTLFVADSRGTLLIIMGLCRCLSATGKYRHGVSQWVLSQATLVSTQNIHTECMWFQMDFKPQLASACSCVTLLNNGGRNRKKTKFLNIQIFAHLTN